MVGSEGILGVVTRATLKVRPLPAATWTALTAFDRLEDAVLMVSEIIAAGIEPAALEMCDQRQVNLCEDWQPSGYPRSAAAILFAELDGGAGEGRRGGVGPGAAAEAARPGAPRGGGQG